MEEMIANERNEQNQAEDTKTSLGKDSFRMYYALGPGLEQGGHIDCEDEDTADIDEDIGEQTNHFIIKQKQNQTDDELSDYSGTIEDREWKGGSIPPDIVASANHLKVIKVEPKLNHKNIETEAVTFNDMVDQDITDFRRHQVDAQSNLDYFLDDAWEESDFTTNVEESNNHPSDATEMIRMKVMTQVGLGQAQCGPMCNNCSIM